MTVWTKQDVLDAYEAGLKGEGSAIFERRIRNRERGWTGWTGTTGEYLHMEDGAAHAPLPVTDSRQEFRTLTAMLMEMGQTVIRTARGNQTIVTNDDWQKVADQWLDAQQRWVRINGQIGDSW